MTLKNNKLFSFLLLLFAINASYANISKNNEDNTLETIFCKTQTSKLNTKILAVNETIDFVEFEIEIESLLIPYFEYTGSSNIEICDLKQTFSCRFSKNSFYQKTPLYNLYCRYKIF